MNSRNAMVKTVRSFLSVSILCLCAASVALAQAGRGSISGLVSDPAGAVVPGAQVTLLNQPTGLTQHTVTTAAGLYSFISLNPGVYQVTAGPKGFASVARDKVTVSVDQVTEVNITLRVGAGSRRRSRSRKESNWSRPPTPPSAHSFRPKRSTGSRC